jgi:endoglucanase
MDRLRPLRRLVAALILLPLLLLGASESVAAPEPALRTDDNPLAGRPWGVYRGPMDQAWPPYTRATGEKKEMLARIALAPKAKWFGAWIPNADIADKVIGYIAQSQAGDPETLVQMTVFRMVPWEGDACRRLPTKAERASYNDWTDRFASAVGSAHTAIVLQPDGPFALCAPGGSRVPSRLIAYSARVLGALPNTSVYIEVGAADWPAPGQGGVDAVLKFLLPAGIEHARGIALNGTHYSATEDEVARGAAIVQALEARGITGKRVVVNTSSNGRPFEFGRYDGPDAENARVCRSPDDPRLCVTLGIPPTADVANPAWGLPAETNQLAAQYVDGYLWFGRPWLYKQADPFVTKRALALVSSTPY